MALQELSAALRERHAQCAAPRTLRDESGPKARCNAIILEATPCDAGESERQRETLKKGLVRLEDDLVAIACQVSDTRNTLNLEVQSLRHGLATMAEAVRAVRPVLDEGVEQRAELEAWVSEAEARLSEGLGHGLQEVRCEVHSLHHGLHNLKAEVDDLSALKVRPRLAALERDANDCRRRVAALSQGACAGADHCGAVTCRSRPRSLSPLRASGCLVAGACNEAAAAAETARATASEASASAEDLLQRIAAEKQHREQAVTDVVNMVQKAERASERLASQAQEEVQERWRHALDVEAKGLRCEMRAVAASAEASVEGLACMQLSEAERALRAELVGLRRQLSEAEVQMSSRLTASLQDADARSTQLDAALRARLDAVANDAGSVARSAVSRAMRPINAEVVSERRQRLASHEELLASVRGSEQTAASEHRSQIQALERLSESVSEGMGSRRHEERGLWSKVHELSRTIREQVPAVRSLERQFSETREELQQQVRLQLEARARSVRETREELQQEVRAHLEARTRSVREDILRELSVQLEEQTKRILKKVDIQSRGTREDLQRELFGQCDEKAKQMFLEVDAHAESHIEDLLGKSLQSIEHGRLEEHADAVAAIGDTWRATEEVRSELTAFMDEQRVFCGFLDTEQRSYQELMRQEVSALSRLIDSSLRRDTIPPLPVLVGTCCQAQEQPLELTSAGPPTATFGVRSRSPVRGCA